MTFRNKLIIYDNDETLARTSGIINGIFIDTLHPLAPDSYRQFTAEFVTQDCVGITVKELFDKMAQLAGIPLAPDVIEKILHDYQKEYVEKIGNLLPKDPEQIQIITDLSTHFSQCVASNGRRRNVEATVAAVGVGHIIQPHHIFSAEDPEIQHPKPAPDMIWYAMKTMGITDPRQVIFLDDSPHGCQAGLEAGVVTVGFTRHIDDKAARASALRAIGVKHVIDNWNDFQIFALG